MQIVLEEALFENSSNDLDLLAIFWLALHREHRVRIDSLWQPGDGGAVQRWAMRHGPGVEDVVNELLGEFSSSVTRRRGTTIIVTAAGATDGVWPEFHLPLGDTCQLAATPLSVLVESWRTDREFLLTVAPGRRRREALERAMDCSNLVFDNGGGVESMTHYVRQLDETTAARTFVISDSDDRGHGPSVSVEKLRDACDCQRAHGLTYHALQCRAIENYLPARVLGQWKAYHVDRATVVDAFCNEIGSEQRRCFNMKRGFGRNERPADSPVFDHLDARTIARLGQGFGPKLMAQVLFEHRIPIREEDLRREGHLAELEALVDAILDHL